MSYKDRVLKEHKELKTQIDDLAFFLETEDKERDIRDEELERMAAQLDAMQVYEYILLQRIKAF